MEDSAFWRRHGDPAFWKTYYLRVWKGVLTECLGWSHAAVLEWAHETGFLEALDDPSSLIYHEPAQSWITTTLIPGQLKASLSGLEQRELESELEHALMGDIPYFRFSEQADWTEYRRNVGEILAKYAQNHQAGLTATGD